MNKLKLCLELFWTFFKLGSVTFGGGYAMLPLLERELVDKKKWTTREDLLDYYAIGQTTPGVIAVNVSSFIGNKLGGVIGSIFSTLGMITPSIIIITLISNFISNFEQIEWVQKALRGINVAVAALMTKAVLDFAKNTIKNWWTCLFFLLSFAVVFFFKVNNIFVILFCAIVGIIMGVVSSRKNK